MCECVRQSNVTEDVCLYRVVHENEMVVIVVYLQELLRTNWRLPLILYVEDASELVKSQECSWEECVSVQGGGKEGKCCMKFMEEERRFLCVKCIG